jgi:hypothetical protein
MASRTIIYIDEALLSRVRQYVPARRLSQLVNELLTAHIDQLEQAALEAQMREGYQATRLERQEVHRDWQVLDGEGWPT